jgi:hypothetical protein
MFSVAKWFINKQYSNLYFIIRTIRNSNINKSFDTLENITGIFIVVVAVSIINIINNIILTAT